MKSTPRVARLTRLLALVKPYRLRFFGATVALFMGSGVALVYPQAARYAVDAGVTEGSVAEFDRLVAILLLVFVAHGLLLWGRHYLMSWLGERVVTDLRNLVYERLLTFSLAWFHERRMGELVGRLASDVTVIQSVLSTQLSMSLRNTVQLIGGLILLFVVDARLTLYMLLVVPPLVLLSVRFGRWIRRMSVEVQDRLAEASAQVQESLGAIQTVQSFVREDRETRSYRASVESAFRRALSLAGWRASYISTITIAGYLAVVAVIWLGGREVIRGTMSAGDLTAFLLYTFIVATSLGGLATLWGALERASGATQRLFAIVDTVPDIRDPEAPVPLPDGRGAVTFENVHFHYPSRPDKPVLNDINLQISPGEVVALVGPSGAGKTTLLTLLSRFYDPIQGVIRLEGIDIRSLRLAEVRRTMAVVTQEPILFSGTIRANIGYARDGATTEQIEAAARQACAHEFIVGFPDGYDTLVGERGVKLSGGQKQRVAIARAILADPRILILDEATSNLDAENEALVQVALKRLMKERTTLLISHRLSAVRDADTIVVVDDNRIVERGSHEQLMANDGVYHRLVEHQIISGGSDPGTAQQD